ncbi:MAG TPA: hypothetical protein VFU32_03225 [Ktedonobacterales bacterium]|nr:hypothetical protein [Ktedonobacterales bacterium]
MSHPECSADVSLCWQSMQTFRVERRRPGGPALAGGVAHSQRHRWRSVQPPGRRRSTRYGAARYQRCQQPAALTSVVFTIWDVSC